MPELKNSVRTLYKATHVAIVTDVKGRAAAEAQGTGAAAKMGFLRSLGMSPNELQALRDHFREEAISSRKTRSGRAKSRTRKSPRSKAATLAVEVEQALRAIARVMADTTP